MPRINTLKTFVLHRWPGSLAQLRWVPLTRAGRPALSKLSAEDLESLARALGWSQDARAPRRAQGQTQKIVEQLLTYYNGGEFYFADILHEARWADTRFTEAGVKSALRQLRAAGRVQVRSPRPGHGGAQVYSSYDPSRPVREYDRAAGLQSPINLVSLDYIENEDLTPPAVRVDG